MINEKTCLLIGGPCNGRRMTVSGGRAVLMVPVAQKLSYAFSSTAVEPIAAAPRATAYYLEGLHGKDRTIWFYRHESIELDQALAMLFEEYPTDTTHPA